MRKPGEDTEQYTTSPEWQRDGVRVQGFGRKILMALNRNQANEPTGADFADVHPSEKIAADARYVQRFECFIAGEEGNAFAPAKVFEQMFAHGVMLGNWLGNLRFEDGHTVEDFGVETHNTLRYDDIRNRIDIFATLTFPEAIEDEDYGVSLQKVALGFDVTTNNDQAKLLDKLTRFYNGNQALPFGFS